MKKIIFSLIIAALMPVSGCLIDKTVYITGITLESPEAPIIVGGEPFALSARIEPANATDKRLTWKSSNQKVVTVDDTGKLTAVAPGEATITVTTVEGEKEDECQVIVIEGEEEEEEDDEDDDDENDGL